MTIKKMPGRGEMKFRITLQQKTSTSDGAGGFTVAWTSYADLWAYFDDWKGKKVLIDGQIVQIMVMRMVTAYYLTDALQPPDSSMRVLFNGRYFNIYSLYDVEERHEFWEFGLTEGQAT